MNPTIKARIEKIKNGEVPEGYKRTKAGILPLDWRYGLLNEVTEKITTKNRGKNFTKILTNSANEGIVSQTDYFDKQIANTENIEGYYVVKKGYFVYNPRISVAAPCGPINCYHGEETGVMSPLYTVFSFNSQDVNIAYIEYYFASSYWYKYMKSVANYGVRSDRMNITDEDFFLLPIPIPESTEQQKIAEILATQDKVIELKEKLLKEKQRQKKYLMQQLLTGKKRLTGFSEEWGNTKLKDLLHERKTYSPKGMGYPHVTLSTGGISPKTERYDRDHLVKDEEKAYKITHKGDICYNPANLKFGVICENTFGDAIFSPIYVTFEVKEGVSREYLANYLMRSDFINAVRKYEEGTVYERMAVKPEDFLEVKVCVPQIEEQVAVAKVLSMSDYEIDLLRQSIEQERQKKKALMQLLLTGIVRVRP